MRPTPLLVLMHGGSGSLDDAEAGWSALAPSFAEHYRVLALEHRGHGRTGNPAGRLDYDLLATDLRSFVDALELGPVHFAGLSDGGITGLHLVLDSPEVLSSLVCVGTNFRVDEPVREALRNAEPDTAERLPGSKRAFQFRTDPRETPNIRTASAMLMPSRTAAITRFRSVSCCWGPALRQTGLHRPGRPPVLPVPRQGHGVERR